MLHKVSGRAEHEMALLPWLVDPHRAAVDVGANKGSYTWPLSRLARHTWAVEANPQHVDYLKRIAPTKVSVLNVAASDHPGELTLRFPAGAAHSSGLATVATDDRWPAETQLQTQTVPAARLDDLVGHQAVGFLKIDVEGHELAVLSGAQELLRRDAPVLLVEAEERHRVAAVASLVAFLAAFDYTGMMLCRGQLTSVQQFDPELHQEVADSAALDRGELPAAYINNFIFFRV